MRLVRGRTVVWLGLLAAFTFVACAPPAMGQLELERAEVDFGVIPNTVPVSRTLGVRNAGSGLLEITGLTTSCSCTTASTASTKLGPGEETELTVTFDPLAHAGATGEFLRKVFVRSTDPDTPEAVLVFRVTVVEP